MERKEEGLRSGSDRMARVCPRQMCKQRLNLIYADIHADIHGDWVVTGGVRDRPSD